MIPYFETHITEACNLNCRGCSHFSVLAKPKHKDLAEFEREYKRLAEIEEIHTMRLMGGEPLLNPDFMEYLRIARRYFPRSHICLVTNGTLGDRLRPHTAELAALRINVTKSEYHITGDAIDYTEHHEKGQLYNISLDPTGSQNKDMAFHRCDIRQNEWYYFMNGRFYPCCIAGTIRDFWSYFGLDWNIKQEDMSIDIFTHTAEEIEAFLHQPIELCRYCDTMYRQLSYAPFSLSEKKIEEWTV